MHGVSAFSSAVIGFPGFPFDLPFAFLEGPLGASLGVGALTAAATEAWQETLLLGTAGVFAFGLSPFFDCEGIAQLDRAFTSSRSQPKTLAIFPKDGWTHAWRNHLGIFYFINHPLQTTYGPKLMEKKLSKHSLVGPLLTRNLVQNLHQAGWKLLQVSNWVSIEFTKRPIEMWWAPHGPYPSRSVERSFGQLPGLVGAWLWRVQLQCNPGP